jgi:hypothetical protein
MRYCCCQALFKLHFERQDRCFSAAARLSLHFTFIDKFLAVISCCKTSNALGYVL